MEMYIPLLVVFMLVVGAGLWIGIFLTKGVIGLITSVCWVFVRLISGLFAHRESARGGVDVR